MIELLSYAFVRLGLIGAVIIGASCSLIGVFVVLRGMSYIGSGIAHGCLAGVALALLMGWNPLIASIIAGLLMVFFVEVINQRSQLKVDTSIGVMFSFALALAVLFIGMLKRYTPEIMTYLFGNLLRVTGQDLWMMGIVGFVVALIIILFFKELQYSAFDPEMAEISGIPAGLISLMLSLLMALTIVVSLQAVGELLVLALIILPASTARQLTDSLKRMIVISMLLGISSSFTGLIAAFYIDAPTGSTIVMFLGMAFFAAMGFKKIKRMKAGYPSPSHWSE